MKNCKRLRRIKESDKYDKQWNLHQNIGEYIKALDILPDAARVRKDRQRSAPLNLLDMVF